MKDLLVAASAAEHITQDNKFEDEDDFDIVENINGQGGAANDMEGVNTSETYKAKDTTTATPMLPTHMTTRTQNKAKLKTRPRRPQPTTTKKLSRVLAREITSRPSAINS